MKTAEVRALSVEELAEKIETAKAQYNQMLLNHAVSPLENPSEIKKARRDIARMMTILTEKKNAN
ncbi:MAG: 50S ribosomal protein L29 [Bacteroidaceae bacterium]|jgi:large subunit ribosomal protein L29|nr:50S ribosomal protein L29 [Prevotella sp.]MBP3822415.1 50S ribosomal protein L29 [Bacteroidaceae bacterium]MBQ8938483.1 50S ribosomal protein L29 [Bacteroidaceae bacterium]MBQ9190110.1 50S ribosomal protein L29 [Bacteroidaceae bacterium]MBR0244707.1 50S ribosomal protein L29 [Bacteroidaceae bacterium]